MAKPFRYPIPAFHELPMGCEVEDKTGVRYRMVGKRKVPLSGLPGAHLKTVIAFRRISDGVTGEVSAGQHEHIASYFPPARVRTRGPITERANHA